MFQLGGAVTIYCSPIPVSYMGPFLRLFIITDSTYLSLFTHCSPSLLTLCSPIREEVEKDVFCSLWSLLSRLREELEASGGGQEEADELNLQLIAECFRAQRNACVQSPRNQALLRYSLSSYEGSFKLQIIFRHCSVKIIQICITQHQRKATLKKMLYEVQVIVQ